jgi:hypothetical protein
MGSAWLCEDALPLYAKSSLHGLAVVGPFMIFVSVGFNEVGPYLLVLGGVLRCRSLGFRHGCGLPSVSAEFCCSR